MKKLTYVIIAILLVIPTVIAIKSYRDTQNAPVGAKNAVGITITDMSGDEFTFEKKEEGDEAANLIMFFLSMNSNATPIVALPDSVVGAKCYGMKLFTPVREESYQYYMSLDPSLCYYVAPDGSAYQLAVNDAATFLETKYAESLYDGATQPTVTVSGEFSPAPVSASWKFKTNSGAYSDADTDRFVSDKIENYDISGGLSVTFDHDPDLCSVIVRDSEGKELFNDTSDKLSDLRVDKETNVSVDVSATWYEDAERSYYGDRKYSFTARLTPPATFSILKTEVDAGKFISIVAKNTEDLAKIKFTSYPDLGTTPKFYRDGDASYAFLAIPTAATGEYKLTLSYGGSKQETNLKVNPLTVTDRAIYVSDEVLAASYSEAALAEFDTLVQSLAEKASEKRLYDSYFDGYFTESGSGAWISRGFGLNLIINDDPAKAFLNVGVDHTSTDGASVTAQNAGQVIYAGKTAFTGNLVVIEHGYGLKTWYWNLGEVKVKEGDSVQKSDEIGTAGTTGFNTGEAGVHAAMSVGTDFVCSYDSWADGDGGIIMSGVYEVN